MSLQFILCVSAHIKKQNACKVAFFANKTDYSQNQTQVL